VVERNRPFDTFGWGVVLSDQTLDNLRAADAPSAALIGDAFNHWDDIEVFFTGRSVRSSGHGFCGIGRKRLLNILQDRCLAGISGPSRANGPCTRTSFPTRRCRGSPFDP
jgi:anthraniloyl-CoA monooxygenase